MKDWLWQIGHRWLRRLAIGFVLVLALYAGRSWYLPSVGRFLDVSEPARKVNFALVLGGGSDTRPFVAAALFKAGLVRKILVPRVKASTEAEDGHVPMEDEIIRRVLVARGVPREAVVLLPGECASTADEADALRRFLAEEPEATITVITTTYHTRRARWIVHSALGQAMARVTFVAAPPDGFHADNWWHFESGVRAYATEYVKLAVHGLRR